MFKNKGFSFIEVLIASTILLTMITTIIPIAVKINEEQDTLLLKREIMIVLHDELQPFLWEKAPLPATITKQIKNEQFTFRFQKEDKFVKGCSSFETRSKQTETICLYGIPP